jgi:hypothetical protein
MQASGIKKFLSECKYIKIPSQARVLKKWKGTINYTFGKAVLTDSCDKYQSKWEVQMQKIKPYK